MKNLIEVFIPYREMRRHIHELLNAKIEDEKSATTQRKDQKNIAEPSKAVKESKDIKKAPTTPEDKKKATIQPNDTKDMMIQWKEALLQDLTFVGIVVRL
jgi:hypothetical protein